MKKFCLSLLIQEGEREKRVGIALGAFSQRETGRLPADNINAGEREQRAGERKRNIKEKERAVEPKICLSIE